MRVIAIDGPAGTGKSTVARAVAGRLSLPHLDTGAMYRAVTFAVLRAGLDPHDGRAVLDAARRAVIDIDDDGTVRVDGHDATAAIRGPDVTANVSAVSAHPGLRAELVDRQRSWAADHGGGVIEGRDIGTAVFPDAALKVFLTASPEVRAARRAGEVPGADQRAVADEIARRDLLDSSRAASPLAQAPDAVLIDTSVMSVEEVVDTVLAELEAARP